VSEHLTETLSDGTQLSFKPITWGAIAPLAGCSKRVFSGRVTSSGRPKYHWSMYPESQVGDAVAIHLHFYMLENGEIAIYDPARFQPEFAGKPVELDKVFFVRDGKVVGSIEKKEFRF